MTYKQQVSAAAAALKKGDDANWELARLTYENTKGHGGASVQPGKVSLSEWAADVAADSGRRFSAGTAGLYRRVWASETRVGASRKSWTEAYWDVRGGNAKEHFEQGGQRAIANASPEVKRETFKALAKDRDVIAGVDRETGEVLGKAIAHNPAAVLAANTEVDRHRDAVRRPRTERQTDTPATEYADAIELMAALRAAHKHLLTVVTYAQNIRGVGADDLKEAVKGEVDWIRGACDVIETGVNGGPLDAQLRALLDADA